MFVHWSLVFDTHGGGFQSGLCSNYGPPRLGCPGASLLGFPQNIGDLLFALEILALIQSGRVFADRLRQQRSVLGVSAVFLFVVGLFGFTFLVANFSGH
jgi:hypothetical protein